MATSKIMIWNMALDRISAPNVASVDENSLAANACRKWFPHVVASILEGPHEWSFGNRRIALALKTNDREKEWLYAYALPADMASPVMVVPNLESLGFGLPVPLPGQPYAEAWLSLGMDIGMPYKIEGDTLYTNTDQATLEYIVNDIEESVIGAKLAEAIAAELAAHLAVTLKKDRNLRSEIQGEAEVLVSRAIADDLNRHPRCYGEYTSEAMAVRG